MKRVLIEIAGDTHWEVTVPGLPVRVLGGFPTTTGAVPIPPDGFALTGEVVATVLAQLEDNAASAADVAALGQHLLSCLLPEGTWEQWRASGDDFHLAVATDVLAGSLQRLPWELLHDGQRFLALRQQPAVAISRTVGAGPVRPMNPIQVMPKVLAVIGTSLDDRAIQPAAEYLALLDTLRGGMLGLEAHIIVNANRHDLAAACRDIRPDVVHLIAHGDRLGDGSSYVELAPAPGAMDKKSEHINGDQLVDLLGDDGLLPEVLVLTACRTASSQTGSANGQRDIVTFRPSLAADCVRRGVPIVAAMSGAIASQACREFTLGFYGALLRGGNVVQAAAAGRREAFLASDGVAESMDWAYPVVFCEPGVDGRVELLNTAVGRSRADQAAEFLSRFRQPPTFCGRHEVLDAFGRLLSTRSGTAPSVLALCVPGDVPASIKMGASRTLLHASAVATLAGYCVAGTGLLEGDTRALDYLLLAKKLVVESRKAARAVDVTFAEPSQTSLLSPILDPALDAAIRELITDAGEAWDSDQVVTAALRTDLSGIGQAICDQADAGRGLVVMIDDLHAYGSAVQPLLVRAVSTNGLGSSSQRVPFLFSYDAVDDTSGDGAVRAIATFVQNGRAVKIELRPFALPGAWLAYQQLLLGAEEPLIPVPQYRQVIFERMQKSCQGWPEEFENKVLRTAIDVFREMKGLVPATDLDRLKHIIGGAR
jgi:CHAT domain